MHNHKNQTHG